MDVPTTSAFTSSLPTASGSLAAAAANLPVATGGDGTLAGIAAHLGMRADDLQAALNLGQSLAAAAEQQGVSRESIGGFIGTQIQRARMYSGQLPLEEGALERAVDRALDRGRKQDADAGSPAAPPQSYEAVATATYANNARPLPTEAPAGGTISLLV